MKPNPSLTEGSISRTLLQFALPILMGNVLQSLNGSVNSIWVGRYLGEAALTATSNANTVMFLLIAAVSGIAIAATILVGRCIGANNLREAKRIVGTGASFFAAVSVLMGIAGLAMCEPLLRAMRTPPESLDLAVAYMRVIFVALPCFSMFTFAMSVLRGAGDPRTPFYFMLLSVGIDIALNPLLIFGLGPIPRLGIAGSACATLVAQIVGLTALIWHLYRRRNPLCLRKSELGMLRVDWNIARTLIKKGVPMGAQLLVFSLSGVLMISLVNRFGVNTTAAFGATLQLWNYLQMPAVALGMAVSAMAAQNVGARKWDRVESVARVGVLYCLLFTCFGVILLEALDTRLFSLFLPAGVDALQIASHINRVATGSWVFLGITLVLFGVVRATGAVVVPLCVSAVSLLGVRFPVANSLLEQYHAEAIWWSFPVSSALSALLAVLYYKYGGWRSMKVLGRLEVPQAPAEGHTMSGIARVRGAGVRTAPDPQGSGGRIQARDGEWQAERGDQS
jgi:putative MATE family efflux protein